MNRETLTKSNQFQNLSRLRSLVPEFFGSFKNPYTYNPFANLYSLFGFAWGIPVPFVTVGLVLFTLGLPLSLHSMVFVVRTYHFLLVFLLHPLLFYLIFGALGTINKRREDLIRQEAAKVESTLEQLIVKERMAMIGQLAAGVAHEINNPVCILLAKTGFLKSLFPDRDTFMAQAEKDLDKFETHLLRIGDITKGLLSFARQSIGLKNSINFPQLINETLMFMEHGFRKNNITVTRDLGSQIHKFEGCSGEMQQVFLNLLSNALDAMMPHAEGNLTVTFKEGKNGFEINFRDTGTGIPDDIIDRVMEPFFTTKEFGKGTGLGLSISYGIVSKHNGTIRFVSCKGEGTTFYIKFPFHDMG